MFCHQNRDRKKEAQQKLWGTHTGSISALQQRMELSIKQDCLMNLTALKIGLKNIVSTSAGLRPHLFLDHR
jgi:hypothetical protein